MTSGPDPVPLCLLLAIGDRTLEQQLARELPEHGLTIGQRALDGPGLLEAAAEPSIDAALVTADLHRLDDTTLIALRERGIPTVVLAARTGAAERFAEWARVLPVGSTAPAIAEAMRDAVARGPLATGAPSRSPESPQPLPAAPPGAGGIVVGIASGKGAPGKTTVAIGLAAAWGRTGSRVVLVDGDLRGGNVAAHLDLDPRRGIVGVAASTGPLADRIAAELQPGPHCAVLAGAERPELAASLPPEFVAATVAMLRTRFDLVVLDLGAPAEPSAVHACDEVVVVSGADLVSIWNTRVALPALRAGAPLARVSLLLNRVEGREHYPAGEVAQALDLPAVGAVREDRKAARQATSEQRPLTETGGAAARDLRAAAAMVVSGPAEVGVPAAAQVVVGTSRLVVER